MENCVATGLVKFQSIIRSCIAFGQSIACVGCIEIHCNESTCCFLPAFRCGYQNWNSLFQIKSITIKSITKLNQWL